MKYVLYFVWLDGTAVLSFFPDLGTDKNSITIIIENIQIFCFFFFLLNSTLSWQCDANIECISDLAKFRSVHRHTPVA